MIIFNIIINNIENNKNYRNLRASRTLTFPYYSVVYKSMSSDYLCRPDDGC